MAKLKRIIMFLFLCHLLCTNLNCQESSPSYSTCVLYVIHNKHILKKAKEVFPELTKRRDKFLKIKISDKILYSPVYGFFGNKINSAELDDITAKKKEITKEEFDEINSFNTYTIDYLPSLMPNVESNLTIRFSEITENYVVLELLDERLNMGKYRYGKVMQLLLYFDEEPVIKGHYISAKIYN